MWRGSGRTREGSAVEEKRRSPRSTFYDPRTRIPVSLYTSGCTTTMRVSLFDSIRSDSNTPATFSDTHFLQGVASIEVFQLLSS